MLAIADAEILTAEEEVETELALVLEAIKSRRCHLLMDYITYVRNKLKINSSRTILGIFQYSWLQP